MHQSNLEKQRALPGPAPEKHPVPQHPPFTGTLLVGKYYTGGTELFKLPSGTDAGQFTDATAFDITRDSSGHLYIATRNQVRKFAPDGTDLGVAANTAATNVCGLVVDGGGNIFRSTYSGIQKFAADGTLLATIPADPVYTLPTGLALDRSGNLYAGYVPADAWVGLCPIRKYAPDGTDLGVFAQASSPMDLAFDHQGNLLVTANATLTGLSAGAPIAKFAPDGTDLGVFAETHSGHGIALDAHGHVYVANLFLGTVHRFGPDGSDLGVAADTGPAGPTGIYILEHVDPRHLMRDVLITGLPLSP